MKGVENFFPFTDTCYSFCFTRMERVIQKIALPTWKLKKERKKFIYKPIKLKFFLEVDVQ